jgi:hypothetical protein
VTKERICNTSAIAARLSTYALGETNAAACRTRPVTGHREIGATAINRQMGM